MDEPLLTRVGRFLVARGLFQPESLLVVAVSGGPDSLCLLHILAALSRSGGPQLHIAHLDHGFRGEQSADEARTVAATAAAWGFPATISYADVPAMARASREGTQAAARHARYAFLADTARIQAAHGVAVAHTADDQAETVLLHALRGAGPAGLRGMRPVLPWEEWAVQGAGGMAALIRPLLGTTRAEVLVYCAAHGLSPVEDPSNSSPRYARSRVRHRLLPALAAYNPQVVAALGRTAQICGDDHDFMQMALDAVWPTLATERRGSVELSLVAWQSLHPALRRYALRRASARLGIAELSFTHIEAAHAAINTGGPRRLTLAHGLLLDVGYNCAYIISADAPPSDAVPQIAAEPVPIPAPGRTPLGRGWVCVTQREPPAQPSPWWVAIPAELTSNLALRRRRPGDRFRPAGGRGGRRLQDLFVDRKIPQSLRDAWPILVADQAILWVAGLRADERVGAPGAGDIFWVGIVREEEEQQDDAR